MVGQDKPTLAAVAELFIYEEAKRSTKKQVHEQVHEQVQTLLPGQTMDVIL